MYDKIYTGVACFMAGGTLLFYIIGTWVLDKFRDE